MGKHEGEASDKREPYTGKHVAWLPFLITPRRQRELDAEARDDPEAWAYR